MISIRASRHAGARIHVSFEFFPPKTEEMERTLWESIERLAPLRPNFVSVTYGAGGSTRERTHATVKRILAETSADARRAPHLRRARRATRSTSVIRAYWDAGVRHIVALRGDPAGGVGEKLCAASGRLSQRRRAGRRHQAASPMPRSRCRPIRRSIRRATVEADIDMLKAKVDAGATRAITQFFFENDLYFRYLDRVRARGIDVPIVPGIMPVQNFKQARSFRASAPAPRCRAGSRRASTGSTTIRRRAS